MGQGFEKGGQYLTALAKHRRVHGTPRFRRLSPIERDIRGLFMTVCIAAIARRENKIVTVTDFKLSTDTDSIESKAVKVAKVGSKNRWIVMFAGDPSVFIEVITTARNKLAGSDEEAPHVINAFREAFQEHLKRKINDEVLSRYGMTRDQFFKGGRESLGDEEFVRTLYQIDKTDLETEFLVVGFEGKGVPCILSFVDPGVSYIHDLLSFHTIGTGSALAEASLMANFNPFHSLTDIIYRASEAKFLSERAPSVGQDTFLTVFGFDGTWTGIRKEGMEEIRNLWEKKGRPSVPSEAVKLINEKFDWDGTSGD